LADVLVLVVLLVDALGWVCVEVAVAVGDRSLVPITFWKKPVTPEDDDADPDPAEGLDALG
jgi:hypothetical protein